MSMTDARDHTQDTTVIGGYGENPQQGPPAGPSEVPPPPPDAGGDIGAVAGSRDARLVKEKCDAPGCGKMITKKNMDQHKRNVHHIYKRKRGQDQPETPKQDKMEKSHRPPSVDEIVAVVVQMRWPGHVPTDKVPALLEWRSATERFLE